MNRIRLLSEQVANQIAAGEVVERPASVVKELVENALDAKATRITIEVEAGGRALIRITDDGLGMSRDDALLCLERHATSKIQCAEDLQAVHTMGFRGEALPSIASVSRMTITTRERDSDSLAASQIIIHGGKIIAVREAGAPSGTCVEVRQLFFNLPARRKFLRADETERSHIQHYLTLAALAHPEVAFEFIHDQRTVWRLPISFTSNKTGSDSAAVSERWRLLYGSDEGMLPLNYSTTLDFKFKQDNEIIVETRPLRVWGLIGTPGLSRSTRDNQHFFVNCRPVDNRGLAFAISEGYHNAIMKGRHAVCCLFLEIDPSEVDVNIHPSKKEVKFRQEQAVRREVTQAVRNVLIGFHHPTFKNQAAAVPSADPAVQESFSLPDIQSGPVTAASANPGDSVISPSQPSLYPPERITPLLPATETILPARSIGEPKQSADLPITPVAETVLPPAANPPLTDSHYFKSSPLPPASQPPTPLLSVPLRRLGVLGRLYVIFESDRGMVLLDQHAAHERVLYERMLKGLEAGNVPSQRLLLAETVELPPREAQFLRDNLTILTRLGIGLSEFGERTFLLDALPPYISTSQARQFVLETLDDLKSTGQTVNTWRLGEDMIAKTVCRHAVKAHDPLSDLELDQLLSDLRRCEMPYTCPHGRPTLIEMNFRELEKTIRTNPIALIPKKRLLLAQQLAAFP